MAILGKITVLLHCRQLKTLTFLCCPKPLLEPKKKDLIARHVIQVMILHANNNSDARARAANVYHTKVLLSLGVMELLSPVQAIILKNLCGTVELHRDRKYKPSLELSSRVVKLNLRHCLSPTSLKLPFWQSGVYFCTERYY